MGAEENTFSSRHDDVVDHDSLAKSERRIATMGVPISQMWTVATYVLKQRSRDASAIRWC